MRKRCRTEILQSKSVFAVSPRVGLGLNDISTRLGGDKPRQTAENRGSGKDFLSSFSQPEIFPAKNCQRQRRAAGGAAIASLRSRLSTMPQASERPADGLLDATGLDALRAQKMPAHGLPWHAALA